LRELVRELALALRERNRVLHERIVEGVTAGIARLRSNHAANPAVKP
jgi:hypothetical protein